MKLTIITINLNNASGLRKTIESVVSQIFTNFEYIVIDGASTDGSVDIIKEYSDKISYWVSEPDMGIYNAMNKGILKATGEYCLFLNSGDWLVDNRVIDDFSKSNLNENLISGNMLSVYEHKVTEWVSPDVKDIDFHFFYVRTLPQPSTFIQKKLFTLYGLFNEENKLVSDWEFFMVCTILKNCTYAHFNRFVTYFDKTGISSRPEWQQTAEDETEKVFSYYFPFYYKSFNNLYKQNQKLKESLYEYDKLKSGRFRFIIKMILFVKTIKVHFTGKQMNCE